MNGKTCKGRKGGKPGRTATSKSGSCATGQRWRSIDGKNRNFKERKLRYRTEVAVDRREEPQLRRAEVALPDRGGGRSTGRAATSKSGSCATGQRWRSIDGKNRNFEERKLRYRTEVAVDRREEPQLRRAEVALLLFRRVSRRRGERRARRRGPQTRRRMRARLRCRESG